MPVCFSADASSSLKGLYVHDDELGPYAFAELTPWTRDGAIATAIRTMWPRSDAGPEMSTSILVIGNCRADAHAAFECRSLESVDWVFLSHRR